MCKKLLVAVTIVILLLSSLAAPTLCNMLAHDTTYFLEGRVNLERQAGHLCNTGGEMKQVVSGDGTIRKFSNIYMQNDFLQVVDNNDWFTAMDALRNLEVATAIELCMPPKHVYPDGTAMPPEILYPLISLGVEELYAEPLTSQVWATSISPEPGYWGALHTGFDAAYGPYAGAEWIGFDDLDFLYLPASIDQWRFFIDADDDDRIKVEWGPNYIGNYFTVQQYARVEYGVARRLIDMSSPWSHGYLVEGYTVAGSAEISEVFSIRNHVPALMEPSNWWALF